MTKLTTILLLFLFAGFAQAQVEAVPVDRDEVEKRISDPKSPEYYPTLMKRFHSLDTTLTNEEYRLIYYGFVFQPEYSAYADQRTSEINTAIEEGRYKDAETITNEVLAQMPVCLSANYYKYVVLWHQDSTDVRVGWHVQRYFGLVGAIYSSGDGLSCETAFKTIFVTDEYNMIYYVLEIPDHYRQSLVGMCDMFDIAPSDLFPAKQIWFDTSETFLNMRKMLGMKDDSPKEKKKKKRRSKKSVEPAMIIVN